MKPRFTIYAKLNKHWADWEEVDTANTQNYAQYLFSEYRMSLGNDFELKIYDSYGKV